jgi:ABC-type uncharacterized transport system permease subunit
MDKEVILCALMLVVFSFCLLNAARLGWRGRYEASILFWAVGSAGILGLATFGLPIMFGLF